MDRRVFISYANEDQALADHICAALEAAGVDCWMASRNIGPGQTYASAIVGAISAARHFVLVFSGHANASRHVANEVERAFSQGLAMHPLRFEAVKPSAELEYFLSRPQWIDLLGASLDEGIGRFVRAFVPLATGSAAEWVEQSAQTPVAPAGGTRPSPSADAEAGSGAAVERFGSPALGIVPQNIRVVRALAGHRNAVRCVAYSPDGKLIASGSGGGLFTADNSVRIWRARDGAQLRVLDGHEDAVNTVAFSPDGSLLASGASSGEAAALWTLSDGGLARTMEHGACVRCLAFSPDGSLLASGSSPDIAKGEVGLHLLRVADGSREFSLSGHTDQVMAVAFSPSGDILASGSLDCTVRLWDVANGRLINTLSERSHAVKDLTFSTDGKALIVGRSNLAIEVWDIESGAAQKLDTCSMVTCVAVSRDGQILAAGTFHKAVHLWCMWDLQKIHTMESGGTFFNEVTGIAFSPDGMTLASAWDDKLVRLWALA